MKEKLEKLANDWHEAGRNEFENHNSHLVYDDYAPKTVIEARKYFYLDAGTSGAFVVDKMSGDIFKIKSYGVPNKKKFVGHVDEITGADLSRLRWW